MQAVTAQQIEQVKAFLLKLQDDICQTLELSDGKGSFKEDNWARAEGGGGRTRVLTHGAVIEQGGVNFSHVFGSQMPASATAARPELAGAKLSSNGCITGDSSTQSIHSNLSCKCAIFCC